NVIYTASRLLQASLCKVIIENGLNDIHVLSERKAVIASYNSRSSFVNSIGTVSTWRSVHSMPVSFRRLRIITLLISSLKCSSSFMEREFFLYFLLNADSFPRWPGFSRDTKLN